MKNFDYIIAGGGCSGLSLAVRLLPYLKASNKRVLVVDKEVKKNNDRTWCFWEEHPDIFEPVVHRKWNHLSFSSTYTDLQLNIHPYSYKMIRGADFYKYASEQLANSSHITILVGDVERLFNDEEQAGLVIDGILYTADYVFSSIPKPQEKRPESYQYLLQHFQGWVIETESPIFDPESAKIMDFNTSQQHGTSFIYVLPLAANRALIEYTVFSEQLLAPETYTAALNQYISEQLIYENYKVVEQENGVIPMSDHPIQGKDGRIIYLGTAGGFTKGSTGYTFRFIQKHTAAIVERLQKYGDPYISATYSRRFNLYDGILLYLLNSGRISGEEIFSTMFKKNNAAQILKFLDNDTSFAEELLLFTTLQKKEFALAFVKRTLKLMKAGLF
ncbi:lycopene beta-cyclase [Pedobacter sp. CG_S7]|uniref:lycopene cyclase family protein n=1 Tax=Pedobacter sp. CG_S7 TaxID=3143930 RepID=UPI003397C967